MSADLEELLRRTYAEVAARTAVTSEAVATTRPPRPPAPPRRGRLLAAAAVVAIVVGGLALLADRDAEPPAGRGTPTRVAPGWVPRSTTPYGFSTTYALTELSSTGVHDIVTYSAAAGSITLTLDRGGSSLPDGTPTEARGAEARRTDHSLAWVGPGGAVVEVTWSGDVTEPMVESFVQGIVAVDDAAWAALSSTGGFRERSYEPLATVRVDADVPFDVELVGDLHEGLSLRLGPSGYSTGSIDRCAASVNDSTSDFENDIAGYVVLAPGDVEVAVVRPIGDDERRVEMTSLLPLADVSIGGVVYEGRSPASELPRVDCEARP